MKGETTLETIQDLVLAAIGILVFTAALTSLLFPMLFSQGSGDEKYANNFLQILNSQVINSLEVDEYTETLISTLPKNFMIIGFGTENDEISLVREDSGEEMQKPDECGGNACLCLYEKRDLSSCKVFEGEIIFLGTDSLACNSGDILDGFEYPSNSKNLNVLAIEPFKFTSLVLGKGREGFNYEGTHRGCENSDLYIEKKTFQNKHYILITEAIIGKIRNKYIGLCSQSSEEFCKGKQEFTINQTENKYCNFDIFTGKCEMKELVDCEGEITETCLCEDKMREVGICKIKKYYALNCDPVTECKSYARFWTNKGLCPSDPCSVSTISPCIIKSENCMSAGSSPSPGTSQEDGFYD